MKQKNRNPIKKVKPTIINKIANNLSALLFGGISPNPTVVTVYIAQYRLATYYALISED